MGRDKRNEARVEQYTKLIRVLMETEAWRSLSTTAQALYPWLRLEWKGVNYNNNGQISLSVRQAADRLGVSINTAARAFHDLQAKGFLVVTKPAHLGLAGRANSPTFELTELPLPNTAQRDGRKLYRQWKWGDDFPVSKAVMHRSRFKKTNPCSQYYDVTS